MASSKARSRNRSGSSTRSGSSRPAARSAAPKQQAQGRWDPADLRLTFVPDVTTEEPAIAAGNVALAPAQPIRVGRVSLYVA